MFTIEIVENVKYDSKGYPIANSGEPVEKFSLEIVENVKYDSKGYIIVSR